MRYGVVGGGVLGLTLGLRLLQRGHQVHLFEQAATPGGLAAGFEVAPGVWLERYYHHLFRSDRAMIGLLDELGLAPSLRWYRPSSTMLLDQVPVPLDSARALLAFRHLPPLQRLRTGAVIAALRALPTPRLLEGSRAAAWMRRTCGDDAYRCIWGPLLEAKFGTAAGHVSMAWLWGRLHDRTPQLGYVDGGFHRAYAALVEAFTSSGGELSLGARVERVEHVEPGGGSLAITWRAESGPGRTWVERLVSTLPPAQTARIVPGLEQWAAASGSGHPPLAAQCLVLALDRPLTGIYWIGTPVDDAPFLAVVEHTAMVPSDAYGGRHLVYLGAYREQASPLLALPAADLVELATPLLRVLNPAFDGAWVIDAWAWSARDAQPIVDTGYRRRLPPLATPVPGVWCASMFHVYPHDRGQNYSVELAERLVRELEAAGARVAAPAHPEPDVERVEVAEA